MLGSWKVILQGDFSGIPFTAFWRHRCAAGHLQQGQPLCMSGCMLVSWV